MAKTVSDYVNINKALCHVTQLHDIAHVKEWTSLEIFELYNHGCHFIIPVTSYNIRRVESM